MLKSQYAHQAKFLSSSFASEALRVWPLSPVVLRVNLVELVICCSAYLDSVE
jgi:hypothetical protein